MKDIVERIDELFPFMAGVAAGRTAGKSIPLGARARGSRIDNLYMEVIYHKEKDLKKALKLVIKDKNLDRKTAKQLKKYVKHYS